jgi:hypothetical protein
MSREQEIYDRLIDRIYQVFPVINDVKNGEDLSVLQVIEKVYEMLKDTTSPLDLMIIASFVTAEIYPIQQVREQFNIMDEHINPN